MGDFSLTCSISGLSIPGGTHVRCLLLTASPYVNDDPRRAWIVRTPPLRAVYNSYGSIEDVHEDDKFIADLWTRGLREDLVEKGIGDNTYHDLPARKAMSFDELLESVQAGCVQVRQDTKHFWRRPLLTDLVSHLGDEERARRDATPSLGRIERVLADDVLLAARLRIADGTASVSSGAEENKFVVDEPVPHLVRVRFGQYQHGADHIDALHAAREAVERAGFVGVVAAGSGRYAGTAELMVFPAPNGKHVHGPQWDMAAGQSADQNKHLTVAMAMVREDVWQALVHYPHSDSVGLDCLNCGQQPWYHKKQRQCPTESINKKPFKEHAKGSRYEHGPVFPDGIEHVIVPGSYGRDDLWFDVAACKHGTRTTWEAILRRFRLLESPEIESPEAKERSPENQAMFDKLFAGFNERRDKEQARIASLPQKEREEIEARQKAERDAWEAQERDKKENPRFGDFLISDSLLDAGAWHHPGAWILRDSVPGVIGISDHLSMCLADKVDVPTSLLDVIAELSALYHHLRNVGVVWKPSLYTGSQYPEWTHHARFLATLSKIVDNERVKEHARRDKDDDAGEVFAAEPATLAEAAIRYASKKAP